MPDYIFFRCSNGNYALFSPYSADFVEDLKSTLEWWERFWNSAEKAWIIDRSAFKRAAEVCSRHGKVIFRGNVPDNPERQRQEEAQARARVADWEQKKRERDAWERQQRERQEREQREQRESDQRERARQQAARPTNGSGCPYRTLHLQLDAPIELVRAAYRALALIHHPDRGGDTRRMQEINSAFDQIKRLKGER